MFLLLVSEAKRHGCALNLAVVSPLYDKNQNFLLVSAIQSGDHQFGPVWHWVRPNLMLFAKVISRQEKFPY